MMNKVEMSDEMMEHVIGGSLNLNANSALAKALKKVSSGMKINSACLISSAHKTTDGIGFKASIIK